MNQNDLGAVLGAICIFAGVIVIVALVIVVFFLLSMQKALNGVSPRNRLMEPGMVWLLLIPIFNYIWAFYIATRIPDSLKNEFHDRGRDDGSDYGKSIGLTYATISVVSIVLAYGPMAVQDPTVTQIANCVSSIFSLVLLVLGIMFWIKIAGYSSQLAYGSGRGPDDLDRRLDKFDDPDDDDRDAPRGGGAKSPDTFKEGDPGGYK